jgi:hypothetical protein
MNGVIEIPKIGAEDFHLRPNAPGWCQPVSDGQRCKPIIRCNCGRWVGMGLHHVHADGTVTASFYHKRGTNYAVGESEEGCEWHVFLKLKDYDGGEFLSARGGER